MLEVKDTTIKHSDEEIESLREEINRFKREKEKVRSIVGKIGGMPTFHSKIIDIVFYLLLIGLLIVSFFVSGNMKMFMIDLSIAVLSLKIMYLIHNQTKVNHFILWVLSTIEWQVNDMNKKISSFEKKND